MCPASYGADVGVQSRKLRGTSFWRPISVGPVEDHSDAWDSQHAGCVMRVRKDQSFGLRSASATDVVKARRWFGEVTDAVPRLNERLHDDPAGG